MSTIHYPSLSLLLSSLSLGFDCRCGHLFCSLHRHADEHNCTFDYKAMGREQIEKHNPKVVGEKIQKI